VGETLYRLKPGCGAGRRGERGHPAEAALVVVGVMVLVTMSEVLDWRLQRCLSYRWCRFSTLAAALQGRSLKDSCDEAQTQSGKNQCFLGTLAGMLALQLLNAGERPTLWLVWPSRGREVSGAAACDGNHFGARPSRCSSRMSLI